MDLKLLVPGDPFFSRRSRGASHLPTPLLSSLQDRVLILVSHPKNDTSMTAGPSQVHDQPSSDRLLIVTATPGGNNAGTRRVKIRLVLPNPVCTRKRHRFTTALDARIGRRHNPIPISAAPSNRPVRGREEAVLRLCTLYDRLCLGTAPSSDLSLVALGQDQQTSVDTMPPNPEAVVCSDQRHDPLACKSLTGKRGSSEHGQTCEVQA